MKLSVTAASALQGTIHIDMDTTDDWLSSHYVWEADWTVTAPPALTMTTMSPLPAGESGVGYSQTLAASGGGGALLVPSQPCPADTATRQFGIYVTEVQGGSLMNFFRAQGINLAAPDYRT